MHLTVHEQPAATASINQVDVVLAEGVAHATIRIQDKAEAQKVQNPLALQPLALAPSKPKSSFLDKTLELKPIAGLGTGPVIQTEDDAANKVIEDSIKAYGVLTGSFADDKKLMDWLVAEYKKPL